MVLLGLLPVTPAAAQNASQRAATRLLSSQHAVRDGLLGLHLYDVTMGDKTIGSASVEITRTSCDGGDCYRLETREATRPRGGLVERHAILVARPNGTVESASEVRVFRHDPTQLRTAVRQPDGDLRERREAPGQKATIEYTCGDATMHHAALFLAMLLAGEAKARTYEFETCWGPEESTPTAFELAEKKEIDVGDGRRTLQGMERVTVRPRPVGFLAVPPDPPLFEDELWFDPTGGPPVVWTRQDDAGPMRFVLRDDGGAPVEVGRARDDACALQTPEDAAICYLLAGAAGDLDGALAVIDLSRYAAHAVANVPGLASSLESQGSQFGADEARDLVERGVTQLRRPDTEVGIPLRAESFTAEQDGDRAVLTPVPARVDLPDVEATRLVVERDAGGDWRLVYVGREGVRSP